MFYWLHARRIHFRLNNPPLGTEVLILAFQY